MVIHPTTRQFLIWNLITSSWAPKNHQIHKTAKIREKMLSSYQLFYELLWFFKNIYISLLWHFLLCPLFLKQWSRKAIFSLWWKRPIPLRYSDLNQCESSQGKFFPFSYPTTMWLFSPVCTTSKSREKNTTTHPLAVSLFNIRFLTLSFVMIWSYELSKMSKFHN